ncbi:long-chain fatty acid--CoA ligase [Bordetella genomosp. 5]|uniref:class I adenylate-forming enzyme family protein n=1 Tax=Bordetella genomosp. 5 TaxID=1395608 RepID=UPI000B9E6F03|nr:long-chain fatty acid--CoA ligase [Bordetella genomosp. 5]
MQQTHVENLHDATRIDQILAWQATRQPGAPCLRSLEGDLTYAELDARVTRAAAWLRDQGAIPGQRVLLVGENGIAMVVALLACSRAGAWPVGVNARLSEREVGVIADHAEPVLTLYTAALSREAAAHAQAGGARAADAGVWGEGIAVSHRHVPPAPETGALRDQVATVIYTSGTTGAPKGVLVPHRGLLHFARISAASRRLVPADVAYAALPISHIFGIATVLLATLYGGASLVLRSRFDPADVLDALRDPGLTVLQGVPTMFTRLLAHLREHGGDGRPQAPRLRYLYTGGAALDPTLKRDVQAAFGLPLHHGYGITEYAGSLFITDIDAPRDDCAAGCAVEGVELRIGAPESPPLPAGERGEILVRGPGVMLGYYRDPAQSAHALPAGGWLRTGDIGLLGDDGALHIVGRSKDLIIRSGFNVYPLEVESVINAWPGVRLSAVVGRPEPDGNEAVVAFIEPLPGAAFDRAGLMAHLRTQLAPYKRPAELRLIDSIPTTVSGKILKQPLRERLAARP